MTLLCKLEQSTKCHCWPFLNVEDAPGTSSLCDSVSVYQNASERSQHIPDKRFEIPRLRVNVMKERRSKWLDDVTVTITAVAPGAAM